MLGYYSISVSLTPSNFFFVFRSIPIGRHSTSLRSATLQRRWTAKLIFFFFLFGPTCTLFDLLMALRLRHDPLEVTAPTHCSGLVKHRYPYVPTDKAHGRPRQVGPAYQKTRQPDSEPNRPDLWPTRPPKDLPVDFHTTLSATTRLGLSGGFRQAAQDIWKQL
jgi:hypothetical protein